MQLRYDGTLYRTLAIKSTFTETQFFCGYVHSHCPTLSKTEEGIQRWETMCFGSGPIGDTAARLRNINSDLNVWIGFASELRQWVRTESTAGGPYIRIDNIVGRYSEISETNKEIPTLQSKKVWLPVIKSYIRAKRLKVGLVNGRFCLGTRFTEWLIDFSEYVKEWSKKYGMVCVMVDTLIINNKICVERHHGPIQMNLVGKKVLDFKGKHVTLKVIEGEKGEKMKLVPYQTGLHILMSMLNAINYHYDRHDEEDSTAIVQWE